MNREEATAQLASQDAFRRLQAARFFQRSAVEEDHAFLLAAMRREKDKWARNALRQAVVRTLRREAPAPRPALPDQDLDDLLDDIRTRVTEEVAKQLIHEIRPIVGAARQEAAREIVDYEESATRQCLDRLTELLGSLAQLSEAASAASDEEFDLAELVESIVKRPDLVGGHIQLAGPVPLVVVGDPRRVDMVVTNGLRNGLEATHAIESDDPVVITWDRTDIDVWLAIVDSGVGLGPAADRAFEVGTTTKAKDEHFGIGLAIAKRAANSMNGELTLGPREEGGTRLELRWPGVA